MSTDRQRLIYGTWVALDNGDISTERLFAMVGDDCKADTSEVAEAILSVGRDTGTVREAKTRDDRKLQIVQNGDVHRIVKAERK